MLSVFEALPQNRVLAGLPTGERALMLRSLEAVQVYLGDIIDKAGEPIGYLHFPIDAAISMMDVKDKTHTLDVALAGTEGCSGASVAQGNNLSPCVNIVEIGGWTVRVPAATVMELLPRLPYLGAALSRYNWLIMRHVVISVGCSQFHSAPQRVARWLMAHCHRTGLEAFPFTSEFLAAQVGVDPKLTADVLADLQRDKIVEKGYKNIEITNREGLAQRACSCFALTKEATDQYVVALENISREYAG